MADDRWRMADDRWRMADDRCEVRSGGCGDGENGEPTPKECPDLPAEASPPTPQAPSVEMPQESWDLLYGASTGHWPLFSSLATDYWLLLATIPEPLATVLSPLATPSWFSISSGHWLANRTYLWHWTQFMVSLT